MLLLFLEAHMTWSALFWQHYFKAISDLGKKYAVTHLQIWYSRQDFSIICISLHFFVSNSWKQLSVPSDFFPAHSSFTDHHIVSCTSSFSPAMWLKSPRVISLIDHSLFPQVMLVTISSLPFYLSVAAQQALPTCALFTAVSQVFVLNSPCR